MPPHNTSLTKHTIIPAGLLLILHINTPWSNWDGFAPSLISSSLNFKYQYWLASARPWIHFLNFQILLVLASFGGGTITVLSMVLSCRKAVFTSKEFNVHRLDDIMQQDNRSPSLEQVGLSVLKFCPSSKPVAHRQASMIFFSLTTFSDYPSLHCWPKSTISSYTILSYTCLFRHWFSSIILASSCSDLFVVVKVSWIWVSSSFISFKNKLDRRFDNSSSFFDFILGCFVISPLFYFWKTDQ